MLRAKKNQERDSMEFYIDDKGKTRPHHKHWQFCVGSCHAALAHRVDYIRQLAFVHRELKIQRVRFHGIFNDDMKVVSSLRQYLRLPGSEKFGDVSFFQIGRVLDNILTTGMRPFVELGFMPQLLACGKEQTALSYKGNITPPKDYQQWSEFIRAFIRFLLARYGRNEVESWYFEVWNEPNLSVFFAGGMEDYFRLYAQTAQAVKSVDDRIQVGGPATATSSWIPEFTRFCRSGKIPLDFISTHQYAGEPIGHVLREEDIYQRMNRAGERLQQAAGGSLLEGFRLVFPDTSEQKDLNRTAFYDNALQVRAAAEPLPVYYTEWNLSATCTAPKNDTRQVAAYIIKSVLDLDGVLAGSAFWSFSDIFEELAFFPTPFSGSFGLLTVDGIPKPAFYAFKLLSQLGDKRLELPPAQGEVEVAAFEKGDTRQLLLYRQRHRQETLPAQAVTLYVRCEARPAAVTIQRIDETHCNPLKIWQEMGSPLELRPEQAEEITRKSGLKAEPLPFVYRNGEVIIETGVGVNDVQMICMET